MPATPADRYRYGRQVMQSPTVRAALKGKAGRTAVAARAALAAGGNRVTEGNEHRRPMQVLPIQSGTRPRGRPYSRVTVAGGYEIDRRQLLARAIRS